MCISENRLSPADPIMVSSNDKSRRFRRLRNAVTSIFCHQWKQARPFGRQCDLIWWFGAVWTFWQKLTSLLAKIIGPVLASMDCDFLLETSGHTLSNHCTCSSHWVNDNKSIATRRRYCRRRRRRS